jgi:hypothetical protein
MNSLVKEFIYLKIKNKNPAQELNHVPTIVTHSATTIDLPNVDVFYNIYKSFIYDSHE